MSASTGDDPSSPCGQASLPGPARTPSGRASPHTTSPLAYSYVDAPTATSVTPTSGPSAGGTSVTISGTGLTSTTAVTIGGTAASFAVLSSTTVVAVTPPGTAGAADVVVTTEGGSATIVDAFTYVSGPGI